MTQDNHDPLFGALIHSYTRAQALEDGVLVDVSDTAREAGIKFPCAVTRTVWDRYVVVPEGLSAQDERGRLWDIVFMMRTAIQRNRDTDTIRFQLYVRNTKREKLDKRDLVTLKAICGPGDDAEPVITIMLPDED